MINEDIPEKEEEEVAEENLKIKLIELATIHRIEVNPVVEDVQLIKDVDQLQ